MPTKSESERMQAIKDSGCIACMLATRGTQAPDIHHITSGGRRQGDEYTIGLCPWHHRGLVMEGQTKQSMSGVFGPSLAFGKKTFNEFFGSEQILWEVQNYVLREFQRTSWYAYAVPHDIRRRAKKIWTRERTN